MKHAFWDRLLIILCTLMLLALSTMLLGIVIGFLPASVLIEKINLLASDRIWRVVLCVAAALLIVLAVLVFWIVLPRRKGRFSTFALQKTENGELKISVKALENLVQKCISQHPELTVVSLAIYSNEATVQAELRVTLQSDINIPLAISALQKEIKQYVEACTGVDVEAVLVSVESTVPPVPGTDSPYALPEMAQSQLPKLVPFTPAPSPQAAPVAATVAEAPPEEEDTSWMEAKPVEFSEGPGLRPAHRPPEPMPDWLLEREPGKKEGEEPQEGEMKENEISKDEMHEDETMEENEGTARGDAQEGE
ncbi:MAG: alkaline shock response membrane anchor protein AmaP [Clostridia bacterium]|nr:alkaline shock response membrane anchor protein AmaP [Clostridia bacterium]